MPCILLTLFFWLGQAPAQAGDDLTGSLAQLPVLAETNEKGILVDFLKAMQKAYPEGNLRFEVLPFKRSLLSAVEGKVDFHAPILKDPAKTERELGFAYSTANLWKVIFALYTNRSNKDINPANLAKYRIETDAGHVNFFRFPIQSSSCIECSLKKVDSGRIDGYIFAAMESDSVVKSLGLANVRSVAYGTYQGKFVLPLGEKGKKTDAILSKLVERTRKNGDYDRILGQIIQYYKRWRPIP